MNWERIITEITLALIPVFTLALTTLISLGAVYIRQRWAWARQTQVVEQVEAMARSTVLSLQQTLVENLKAANADGKLTAEEKEQVKLHALATLQAQITEGQRKVLAAVTADVSEWLSHRLEEMLVQYKLQSKIADASRPTSSSPF